MGCDTHPKFLIRSRYSQRKNYLLVVGDSTCHADKVYALGSGLRGSEFYSSSFDSRALIGPF